jgi:hypothetical protein
MEFPNRLPEMDFCYRLAQEELTEEELYSIKFNPFDSKNRLLGVLNWEDDHDKEEIPVVDIEIDFNDERIILHIPLHLYTDIVNDYLYSILYNINGYRRNYGVSSGFSLANCEAYHDVIYTEVGKLNLKELDGPENVWIRSVNVYEFDLGIDFRED